MGPVNSHDDFRPTLPSGSLSIEVAQTQQLDERTDIYQQLYQYHGLIQTNKNQFEAHDPPATGAQRAIDNDLEV